MTFRHSPLLAFAPTAVLAVAVQCGIIAYLGRRQVLEILLRGLQRLEYRCVSTKGEQHEAGGLLTPALASSLRFNRRGGFCPAPWISRPH